jgi:hypothetical protein
VVGVRPAGRRERLRRDRPRCSGGRLPHRLAREGNDDRRVSGPCDRLDEEGNLKATSDFRAIYAALLEQWLGTDAAAVLPGIDSFARPALLT